MDDSVFLARFEDASMPMTEWHHREHVKVAYLYVRKYPFEEALRMMREGVKAFNAAHRYRDTPLRGYHETLTRGWLHLVHYSLCEFGPEETADLFFDRNPPLQNKGALAHFYSRELLFSHQAKVDYVEPDLLRFPESAKLPPPLVG
jgi:hypothetical protein